MARKTHTRLRNPRNVSESIHAASPNLIDLLFLRSYCQRPGLAIPSIKQVRLDADEHEILAQVSGKIRKHSIRILLGDRVSIEMSPYDSLAAELLIVTVSWNQHLDSSDWPLIHICCYG
jgi:hypothetical protein